jgi:hypothetical protein
MRKPSPLLSDNPHELLDHVEVSALTDPDKVSSTSQLKSELMVTGSEDALTDEEGEVTLEEYFEGVLDSVLTEAEDRIVACGEENYPFTLKGKSLSSKDSSFTCVYTFLLCLSFYGKDAAPGQNGAKLFEDVCAYAVAAYLGCHKTPSEKHVFGFPRRIGPADFVAAVQDLCLKKLGEGEPDSKVPDIESMKDAGLDIVAWLPFPDKRSSKLIAFGQCATGRYWREKVNELQPFSWCQTWLTKHPKVTPVKIFFVPHAVTVSDWERLGYHTGIVFDRFRIAYFAENAVPESLRDELQGWSTAATKIT